MFIKRFFPLLINSSFEDLFGLSLSFAHQLSIHFFKRRKKITRLHFIFSSRFVFFFFISIEQSLLCAYGFFLMVKEAYVRQCFTTAKMLSFISMLRYTMVYGERKREKNAELWWCKTQRDESDHRDIVIDEKIFHTANRMGTEWEHR